MKARQLNFEGQPGFKDHGKRLEHGGALRRGKRKLARPFDSKRCLHVTLRSTKAKGAWSFLKEHNEKQIQKLVYGYGQRFQVRVFKYANGGNHLHLLLKAQSKKGFQNFLRSLTGMIPRIVMKAEKGCARGKFWDGLAYSKLVHWRRQFKNASNYVFKNALEGFGIIPSRSSARGYVKLDFEELFDSSD